VLAEEEAFKLQEVRESLRTLAANQNDDLRARHEAMFLAEGAAIFGYIVNGSITLEDDLYLLHHIGEREFLVALLALKPNAISHMRKQTSWMSCLTAG